MDDSFGVVIKLTINSYTLWKPWMEDLPYCKYYYDHI